MRRVLALCARIGLHLVTVLMFAAGGAALVAMFAVTASATGSGWIAPIQEIAQSIGFTFLPAAIAAFFVMPGFRQVARRSILVEQPLPVAVWGLMVALALAAAWRIPTLASWWDESLRVVATVRGDGSDPLGWWVFPAAAVVALPVFATMSLKVVALTSTIVTLGRPDLALRLLGGCALLQTGLVAGSTRLLAAERSVFARVVSLMAGAPNDQIPAEVTAAIARQDSFAATLVPWFQAIAIGYWLSTAVMWYLSRGFDRAREAGSEDTSAGAVAVNPLAPAVVTAGVTPSAARPRQAFAGSPAAAGRQPFASIRGTSVFQHDSYAVRLRTSWLAAAFRLGAEEYTITPIPALRSDATFSFSQSSGVLRQEPAGPDLLRIQTEGRGLTTRRYVVSDSATGNRLAAFERAGRDWQVLDADGQPIAHVEEAEARSGFRRYIARVGAREVCRYTWAMQGLGVWTAELDVEFLVSADQGFDRSIAILLAPQLEQQARRDSQRHVS